MIYYQSAEVETHGQIKEWNETNGIEMICIKPQELPTITYKVGDITYFNPQSIRDTMVYWQEYWKINPLNFTLDQFEKLNKLCGLEEEVFNRLVENYYEQIIKEKIRKRNEQNKTINL